MSCSTLDVDEVVLSPGEARRLVYSALMARGVPRDAANDVANSLVGAELAGKPTHGLRLLPGYLADLDAGRLEATATPTVVEHGTHADVRGRTVLGAHLVTRALGMAARTAGDLGCATVSMPDAAHCGRLGGYVEAVAAGGRVAMMTAGSLGTPDAVVSPFGGTGRWLDTNPIAFAFPAAAGPVVIDLATSALSYNQVRYYAETSTLLDAGLACDSSGRPTRSAAQVLDGGWILPFGGPKGFAMGLMAPLLAALTDVLADGTASQGETGALSGAFAIVIDVAARTDPDGYRTRVQAALDVLVNQGQHPGQVRIPGQDRRIQVTVSRSLALTLRGEGQVIVP